MTAINASAPSCYTLEEPTLTTRKITITKNKRTTNDDGKTIFTSLIQPIIAELVGTTFFILLALLGACSEEGKGGVLVVAFSFGLSLMIFVASLGHISGGHFNPAVTLAMFIAGTIQLKKALLYVLMQLIGGIMAGGIFRLLSHGTMYRRCLGGATALAIVKNASESGEFIFDRTEWWEGMCIELLLTFVFVTVILMVAVDSASKTNLAPLFIGFALCACMLASVTLTGGSLNPARSLGPALFANVWSHHYVHWIGPLVGAAIAGGFYRFIWAANDRRLPRSNH